MNSTSQRQRQTQTQTQTQTQSQRRSHQFDDRPWVEKYRPDNFDKIVLEPITRELLSKIIASGNFPNLLLYGPPGTGKTTTIINLVNEFKKQQGETSRSQVIHLNASDERGIDIVRGQISQFVNSSCLFKAGLKVVILDEVDCMTEAAQHALKQLLQTTRQVRFCLICNYVSKIDESMRNEFVRIRFNHLPREDMLRFLTKISETENLHKSTDELSNIINLFGSDMRSMINYLQSTAITRTSKSRTHAQVSTDLGEAGPEVANRRTKKQSKSKSKSRSEQVDKNTQPSLTLSSNEYVESACLGLLENNVAKVKRVISDAQQLGVTVRVAIREITQYLIVNFPSILTADFLQEVEFLVHHEQLSNGDASNYFVSCCLKALKFNSVMVETSD
jgi:DNA polymerase III delta prime subunit